MTDYAGGFVPVSGKAVTFTECEVCKAMYAQGAVGHENPPVALSTDRHKAASAEAGRAVK